MRLHPYSRQNDFKQDPSRWRSQGLVPLESVIIASALCLPRVFMLTQLYVPRCGKGAAISSLGRGLFDADIPLSSLLPFWRGLNNLA